MLGNQTHSRKRGGQLRIRWILFLLSYFGCVTSAVGDPIDEFPSFQLPAPDPSPEWSVTSYAESAGFDHRTTFCLAFSTNGWTWAATSDGLYCHDGFEWKHFGPADGLPSNFIRSVTFTVNGDLWIGTDHGAGVFDWHQAMMGKRGSSLFDRRGSQTGLVGQSVRRMAEAPDGAIWFASDPWPDSRLTPKIVCGLPVRRVMKTFP